MTRTFFASLVVISLGFGAWSVYAQVLQKEGVHKTFHKTGEVRYESEYKNGKLNGVTKEYAKDGTLIGKYLYENDELVGEIEVEKRRDYGPFTIFMSGPFWAILAGVLVGLWFIFAKVLFKERPF